jgi:hypothetical protein
VDHALIVKHLVAVLASPPKRTNGQRTIARVQLAASVLQLDSFSICNLFPLATDDVNEISQLGFGTGAWHEGRQALEDELRAGDHVLFAWGLAEPLGPARAHHRDQVSWVRRRVRERHAVTWTLGGAPRHPSRWQRHTSATLPGVPFETALRASLSRETDLSLLPSYNEPDGT